MINRDRLAETFTWLVKIDSVSREELDVCRQLKKRMQDLGARTVVDDAGEKIGGNTGNLIARFGGQYSGEPIMFNAHMDTVEPGRGIRPVFKDGVFSSDGSTILGADDKSAVAVLLETMTVIRENSIPTCPIEIVFTVCEEIGLMGAKHLNFDLIESTFGYSLDATDTRGIVVQAPSANKFHIKIHGKDAHAGAAPEKGINAIYLAAKAIAGLTIGRIDRETTCNIGIIQGGLATNIVPNLVTVKGEARSHDDAKLEKVTRNIVETFQRTIAAQEGEHEGLPRVDVQVDTDFVRTHIPEDHKVLTIARKASGNLGRDLASKITGGGADANVFFQKGIMTGVLGTGMRDAHSVHETVKLDDMVETAQLVLEIIKIHSQGNRS